MIRVMVVDDSPLFRRVFSDLLSEDPEIGEVITAVNGKIALTKLKSVQPDVITMDLQMPGISGLEVIEKIMATNPIPIVIISAAAGNGPELGLRAMELGVVDLIEKPGGTHSARIGHMREHLTEIVKNAANVKMKKSSQRVEPRAETTRSTKDAPSSVAHRRFGVIAFGASTGGPIALKNVLMELPADFPIGIAAVLHMPSSFTSAYAKRLDSICGLKVKEAKDGDRISPGSVLIAPGDMHMKVTIAGQGPMAILDPSAKVNNHRPSIDVLMRSLAESCGNRALAVIMTGMGSDGAHGTAELKTRGGYVIAQDEASSVIYGMNRAAIENGSTDEVLALNAIASRLISMSV